MSRHSPTRGGKKVLARALEPVGSTIPLATPPEELIIEAGRLDGRYWEDLWRYRELFSVLAWRDISVRYKQTVIGAGWAIIRPLVAMVVFTVIFGKIAQLPSDGIPYPLLVFGGMLPWMLFSTSLNDASGSLVTNTHLISKVYFPRLIVPVAAIMVGVIDFLVSLIILAALMMWYRFVPGRHIFFLPFFIALTTVASLGPSLWISALNVKYRDFRYIVPFILQMGLYVSPVGFSTSVVPEQWRLVYAINPMVGVIDGFRWCLLGANTLYFPGMLISIGVSCLLLWLGLRQFRATERAFADLM